MTFSSTQIIAIKFKQMIIDEVMHNEHLFCLASWYLIFQEQKSEATD